MLVVVLRLASGLSSAQLAGVSVFAPEQRELIRSELIARAEADPAIVAAAVVGASATGADRWSDLDLTFAVARSASISNVMQAWTNYVIATYAAAHLFDIAAGSTIYRVFLFPGALQVDLSFGPEGEWGSRGPRFHLLFGEADDLPTGEPSPVAHLLGYAAHHLVRVRVCIERGRFWQAEHWLHEARDVAMTLACRRHGLDEAYTRGFDQLPETIQDRYREMVIATLDRDALERVLPLVTGALLEEAQALVPGITDPIRPVLQPILDRSIS